MTKEELASKLNWREYRKEITKEEEKEAKESGLIVIYWYSDDNIELRWYIDDEVGAYMWTDIYITTDWELLEECECECKYYQEAQEKCLLVSAYYEYDKYGYDRFIQPDWFLEYAEFMIVDDWEKCCRWIVLDVKDLKNYKK